MLELMKKKILDPIFYFIFLIIEHEKVTSKELNLEVSDDDTHRTCIQEINKLNKKSQNN